MFIIYSNDSEVIVTTRKKEAKMLRRFFDEDGRNVDEYDRTEDNDCGFQINAKLNIW